MNEELAGRAEDAAYVEGEELQTTLRGRLEDRQAEDLAVQVHRDVAPQLLRELLQRLRQS